VSLLQNYDKTFYVRSGALSFDRLLEQLKTFPTDILIFNELTCFLDNQDIHDEQERNWIMKEFKRVAAESNTLLFLVYSLRVPLTTGSFNPELKHFHWSRNMINIAREIYFLYRHDYFGDTIEKDKARLFSLKQFRYLNEELDDFSPVENAHNYNTKENY
jgi:hypothetical protein